MAVVAAAATPAVVAAMVAMMEVVRKAVAMEVAEIVEALRALAVTGRGAAVGEACVEGGRGPPRSGRAGTPRSRLSHRRGLCRTQS